jgi:hypothetical protein
MGTGGALCPEVKRPGREADHSPLTSAEVKKTWIYIHSPIRLHGVVLNWLSKERKKTPWLQSASELYLPSDRLSAKVVPTFADRRCHVVIATDLYCRILGFLDRSRYFFFQAAPQLY